MINVWLNIHLMYDSGYLFLTNGDLEYTSKAYVHCASGKYKMNFDFLEIFPWPISLTIQHQASMRKVA